MFRRSLKPTSSRHADPGDKYDPRRQNDHNHNNSKANGTAAARKTTTKIKRSIQFLSIVVGLVVVFHLGVAYERRKHNHHNKDQADRNQKMNAVDKDSYDYDGPPPNLLVQGRRNFYTPIPNASRGVVNVQGKGGTTIKRSFLHMGWVPTNKVAEAHIIYRAKRYSKGKDKINVKLQPWQRYSRLTGSAHWESKGGFAKGFATYQQAHPEHNLYFLPETYRLVDPLRRKMFEERLSTGGGMNEAWVLKNVNLNNGEGIEILGPNSEALRTAVARTLPNATLVASNTGDANTPDDDNENKNDDDVKTKTKTTTKEVATKLPKKETPKEYIVQKYVCDELTWFHGEKFDLRMFWAVASVDPPIVMYHDGYVRASAAKYNESDFSDSAHHLTNHQFRAKIESRVSDSDLWERIRDHYDNEVKVKGNTDLQKRIRDPVQHVRKQMMESIGTLFAAFKDVFGIPPDPKSFSYGPENFFGVYGADFIIDNDLDVYFIESQASPGFGSMDYDYRIDIFRRIYRPLPGIVETIALAQQANASVNILPLLTPSALGDYELVYAGDWQYKYKNYQRPSTKKRCAVEGTTAKL